MIGLNLITNYGLQITILPDGANVDYERSEVKPQLVVGGIYLITGRFLATVGGWGKKISIGIVSMNMYIFLIIHPF